jgi:osmotically-inducible protein OsmY
MKRIWFALWVATASLLLGTGSTSAARQLPPNPDEVLAYQIWTRLKSAPHLENNRIYVDVDDGIAVLEGTVETESKKKEAQQLAHIDGILGVNNRLKLWVD